MAENRVLVHLRKVGKMTTILYHADNAWLGCFQVLTHIMANDEYTKIVQIHYYEYIFGCTDLLQKGLVYERSYLSCVEEYVPTHHENCVTNSENYLSRISTCLHLAGKRPNGKPAFLFDGCYAYAYETYKKYLVCVTNYVLKILFCGFKYFQFVTHHKPFESSFLPRKSNLWSFGL